MVAVASSLAARRAVSWRRRLLSRALAAASSLARRAVSWFRPLLLRGFAAAGGTGQAKRVLVPVAAGTEPLEAAATADVLNRAGARVTVATVGSAGDDGRVVLAAYGVKLVADGCVDDLQGEAFDLIALPGGMPGSVNLRDCKVLEKMVKKQAEEGGFYGAICAAPAVALDHWGMLKGFKATCHPSFMERFTTEVIPVNSRVVVDRNVVTSQGPGIAIEFGLTLVEQLYGKEKMEEVAGPLYVRPHPGAKYTIEEFNSVEWKCRSPPQVLVPIANGSEEMEALNLIDVLRRAGANVVLASVEDQLQIVTRHQKFNLIADVMLDEAAKKQFDLIVMPFIVYRVVCQRQMASDEKDIVWTSDATKYFIEACFADLNCATCNGRNERVVKYVSDKAKQVTEAQVPDKYKAMRRTWIKYLEEKNRDSSLTKIPGFRRKKCRTCIDFEDELAAIYGLEPSKSSSMAVTESDSHLSIQSVNVPELQPVSCSWVDSILSSSLDAKEQLEVILILQKKENEHFLNIYKRMEGAELAEGYNKSFLK